ncbi:MAG: gamma-glutamyltransferase [Gemmatimonadales bacterium]
MKRWAVAVALAGVSLAACSDAGWRAQVPADWPFALEAEPVRADSGVVVSTDAYASRIGAEVLRSGGNAVDAAIATSFALAVVNPEAGNIGGGGFMVIRFADGRSAALDYRERAPAAAHRDMYLDEDGELSEASVLGHLAVGVPGSVAGLWEAHREYGSLPWADLVGPAIGLAEGFEVRSRQAHSLSHSAAALRAFPATAAQFLPNDSAPALGAVFSQPDLAATLRRIRDDGRDGFYRGRTADLIVAEMERGSGLITHDDLARYEPAWREPIAFYYREHTVISMAPVSSGGATLAAMAKILEGYDLSSLDWHRTGHVHLLAEAWKRAYADRNAYLADPDFVEMPLDRMISAEYAAERRATIDRHRATPSAQIGPGLGTPARERNTTHISVVDAQGNAVALTTTINSFYGSKVTVAGAGFLLNNEMDDFAAQPGKPNQFGLVQGENNAIEPGKRMLSAMTPTIVLRPDKSLFYVTGSPGGATIISNVFQNISNVIDYGMNVVEAVNAPRLHHQHLPDRIQYEPGALARRTIAALEALGHTVEERFSATATYPYIGDVQAIMVMPDGTLEAWSDPRRGGSAVGY